MPASDPDHMLTKLKSEVMGVLIKGGNNMSWLVVSHAVMRNPPNQCGRTECAGQMSHKTGSARTPATATSSFLGMGSDTLGPSGERSPGHLRICEENVHF